MAVELCWEHDADSQADTDTMNLEKGLTIGEVARRAGVNVETIRYYQRKGLLVTPDKPVSGYRRYPPGMVAHIQFIKRAQRVGFSLNDIQMLLSLGTGRCSDVQSLARRKLQDIDEQLHHLQQMRTTLGMLVDRCTESLDDEQRCALLEALLHAD